MFTVGYYIIPTSLINPLYALGETLCAFLLLLVLLASFIELNKTGKMLLSATSLVVIILHYYVYFLLSKYEEIIILPLFIEETRNGYSVYSLDYGQLLILAVILLYHKPLRMKVRLFIKWLKTIKPQTNKNS